ncbi:MAG: hypothetical protein ABSH22_14220 [Tepidisphaeraceae bacterium]|jgi:hypothetical protein
MPRLSSTIRSFLPLLTVLLLLAAPAAAWADDTAPLEARLIGYKENLYAAPSATSTQWLTLVGLGVVCMSVMYLSSKRTHLD